MFVASVFVAIGSSHSLFAGLLSGQVVTPLLLGAMSAYSQEYAVFVLLTSMYAR